MLTSFTASNIILDLLIASEVSALVAGYEWLELVGYLRFGCVVCTEFSDIIRKI